MQLQLESLGSTIVSWWDDATGQSNSTYQHGGVGLLPPPGVSTAVRCSYGLIGLDFWAAGPSAYHGSPIPSFVSSLGST